MKTLTIMKILSRILCVILLFSHTISYAEKAYVGDRLYLGMSEQPGAKSIKSLKNGTQVTILQKQEHYSQVSIADGTTGWVRNRFLSTEMPTSIKLEQLQSEYDKLQTAHTVLQNNSITPAEFLEQKQQQLVLANKLAELQNETTENKIQFWLIIAGIIMLGILSGYISGRMHMAAHIRKRFNGLQVW